MNNKKRIGTQAQTLAGMVYNGGGGRFMIALIGSYFRTFFAVVGAAMILFSEALSMLPFATSGDWQLWGLGLFMVGVILQMVATQRDLDKRKETQPKLTLSFAGQVPKDVYRYEYKPNQVTREKKGSYIFALVSISNNPDNPLRGMNAQNATAEIEYKSMTSSNVQRVQYGRWWDREIPLFPPQDKIELKDIKVLKQVDIVPGHPELLILAFKKKRGKIIHAFHFTDHKEIWLKEKGRRISKPPIKVIIRLRGRFTPQIFSGILSLDKKGNFTWE